MFSARAESLGWTVSCVMVRNDVLSQLTKQQYGETGVIRCSQAQDTRFPISRLNTVHVDCQASPLKIRTSAIHEQLTGRPLQIHYRVD